jgi:hypothetical protein
MKTIQTTPVIHIGSTEEDNYILQEEIEARKKEDELEVKMTAKEIRNRDNGIGEDMNIPKRGSYLFLREGHPSFHLPPFNYL